MTYEDRVFQFLNNLEPERIYKVSVLTKKETRQQFVNTVKKYIDLYPHMNVSFIRDDYEEIRRLELI